MKKLLVIALLLFSSTTLAGDIQYLITWTQPLLREDGTALASSEIAGYTVSYEITDGLVSEFQTVDVDHTETSLIIEKQDVMIGVTYTISVKVLSHDTHGAMSDWSDIVTKSKAVGSDAPPLAPGSIIISVQCTPLCVTEALTTRF
jgi:hypothetical protein